MSYDLNSDHCLNYFIEIKFEAAVAASTLAEVKSCWFPAL